MGGVFIRDKSINCKEWKNFTKLKTADELQKYFDNRIYGHKEFFHYTTLNAINKILENKTIRISSFDRFNDKKDTEQFSSLLEQKQHYSLCFSTGKNENLSLWYLYSGVNGKGGRISLTYNKLTEFINKGEFYLVEYDYENNRSIGVSLPLTNGKNMRFQLRDILYSHCDRDGMYVDLKYNTMTNYDNVLIEEYDKYKFNTLGFHKSLIWYYEKESRLMIELVGDAAKAIDENKNYAIFWKLTDEQIKYFKIMCGPEIADKSELECYKHIKKFIFDTSRTCLSENAGDIEMNICSKCDYKEKFNTKDKNSEIGNSERSIKDDKEN